MVKIDVINVPAAPVAVIEPVQGIKKLIGQEIFEDKRLSKLPQNVREFVLKNINLCKPDDVYLCDGSEEENQRLLDQMVERGMLEKLPKYENCYLATTDPLDVARVESKTFICTPRKRDAIPTPKAGVQGLLGNWISPSDLEKAIAERFPGCMKGRTMYVIPFSMGPLGSPLAKIGVELTDSPYVVSSMRIMTRMGSEVLDHLRAQGPRPDFVKCLHSVGVPLNSDLEKPGPAWPCNPEKTIVAHIPERCEIASFGSGYGGNSLLGKKCFALRIGSTIAQKEGWLAEHMLILGITDPSGKKRYIAAAFPSACGKTNLAMMQPSLPGYKVECVGDDIAWMKFDKDGRLRAINPENGFFGVAPGTSSTTNPNAMRAVVKNTVFTNVAKTADGGVYWEGMTEEDGIPADMGIVSWRGTEYDRSSGVPAAHPNSRFCTPAEQCPIIDPAWEDPEGVPIDAVLFGGRRPEGVPLVYEAFNWQHGVFVGAAMRSEATAAAEHRGKVIMHDPFAMRPFFGYNFGDYLSHWLSMEDRHAKAQLPKIFHVNWFRKSNKGKFLWPGFGENSRVLDWILRRIDGDDSVAEETAVGIVPTEDGLNVAGLSPEPDFDALFELDRDFWTAEVAAIRKYFEEQVGDDLPDAIRDELDHLEQRVHAYL